MKQHNDINFWNSSQCYIIAEAGVNHNGSKENAKKLIDIAAGSGANAIKFQTFKAETLVSKDAPQFPYVEATKNYRKTQFDMLRDLELKYEWHEELMDYCNIKDITFLSTPFHESDVDFLSTLAMPAYKIASGDVSNVPFLKHVASKNKPIIASTGMATISETEVMYKTLVDAGCEKLVILHCTSNYPTSLNDVNLRAMSTIQDLFNIPVGYSDHTQGFQAAICAVAMGASVIEKHFTLSKSMPGPDHKASLEPAELSEYVAKIREAELLLGSGEKVPTETEILTKNIVRKSLFTKVYIKAGEKLVADMLTTKRPGDGIAPDRIGDVVGRIARRDIKANAKLSFSDIKVDI